MAPMISENDTAEREKPPILLVDDEPEILNSLKGLLRREFTLFTATSGKEALEILDQNSIHVIMTDQRMPEMTGAELLGRAKSDSVRIIFTGYADIKAVVDAVNKGHLYRYITKPWDPDDLVEALHDAAKEFSRRLRHRMLVDEMKQFLDEALGEPGTGSLSDGGIRERAELLRSKLQKEIDIQDSPH